MRERIIGDPTFFVSMDNQDLEKIVDKDPNLASKELNKTAEEVKVYQAACERELERRRELRDATELLHLYHRAVSHQNETGNSPCSKRPKSANEP